MAGTVFQAVDGTTRFFGFGDTARPGIGACVEVRLNTATPPVALLIQPNDSCSRPGIPDELAWRGRVTATPDSGFTGTWIIGDKTFTANVATFFLGFGDSPPVIGACVEVEYVIDGSTNLAIKVHPEEACGPTGTTPGEEHLYRGRVDQRPDTRFGPWVIGGRSFEAVDGTTTFSALFGTDTAIPAVGDCVRVFYRELSGVRTIRELSPGVCEGPQPPAERPHFEAHGWLNKKTAESYAIGPVVGNLTTSISYTLTISTELSEAFGPLTDDPPTCVQVEYTLSSGARTALEIKSRPDFYCTASADERELYGTITSLPGTTSYLGTWGIGSLEVFVTADTVLEDGPFIVGRIVKVKFTRASDGTLIAIKIEGKGTPGDGDDSRERGRGKAYGKIESLPVAGPAAGSWTIAGQVYTVSADTSLRDGGSAFAVGDCVEVYFYTVPDSNRLAVKIERAVGTGCTPRYDEIGRDYGFVEAMPTSGYIGTWTIAGTTYKVVDRTEFEYAASVGLPVVGSYVEVKYVVVGGEKLAREITIRVPPGMGDDTYIGRLDDSPSSLAATGTWKVAGIAFQVTDATVIQDGATNVADGALVKVNGYRDAQGNLVATEVTAVTALYTPLISR
ncbi:MAG: hypothetical protein HGA45_24145 [Chloroflexales bacterium]|nr:hypothetical protein [Chloroflexales bacterium]